MSAATIHVKGLKELQRALKKVDKNLPRELRKALNAAADIVVDAAKPKVARRTGAAADSIKAGSTQRAGQIKVGGTKAPYYPWLDFGGSVGRGKSVSRPYLKEGRYIYPTLREKRDEVDAKVDEGLKRLAKQAGFETHGSAD
jgi:HK97 gp10 family phage protein